MKFCEYKNWIGRKKRKKKSIQIYATLTYTQQFSKQSAEQTTSYTTTAETRQATTDDEWRQQQGSGSTPAGENQHVIGRGRSKGQRFRWKYIDCRGYVEDSSTNRDQLGIKPYISGQIIDLPLFEIKLRLLVGMCSH